MQIIMNLCQYAAYVSWAKCNALHNLCTIYQPDDRFRLESVCVIVWWYLESFIDELYIETKTFK